MTEFADTPSRACRDDRHRDCRNEDAVSDALFERCLRVFFKAPDDKPSLELLLSRCEEPDAFRRALAVAFGAGKREGIDEVTDLSVMNLLDAELDTMWDSMHTPESREEIARTFEDVAELIARGDPWGSREAADRVITTVCRLFDRQAKAVTE